MIKMCGSSIIKPLQSLFNNFVKQGVSLNIWKIANVVSVHKKIVNNKLTIINWHLYYQFAQKIFEKLLLDSINEFLDKNCLLNSNESGFPPNGSSMHQRIAITHDIFTAFDANRSLVVRGAFSGLSKTFDRVWHKGLFYKLKCNKINGPFLAF